MRSIVCRLSMCSVVVAVVLALGAAPALASAPRAQTSTASMIVGGLTEAEIARFDPYVTYRAGVGYRINAPVAVSRADAVGFRRALAAIDEQNARMTITNLHGSVTTGLMTSDIVVTRRTHWTLSWFWWGFQVALDEWLTLKFEGVLTAGGALSGIASAAGGGFPTILAAGIAGWDVGALMVCDNGRGVNLNLFVAGPYVMVSSCTPRR